MGNMMRDIDEKSSITAIIWDKLFKLNFGRKKQKLEYEEKII
jgi:hypothetical protein